MPMGTKHELVGLLLQGQRGGLVLRPDDGGEWRLDAGWSVRRLIGRRVRLEGTRVEFNTIDVRLVELA
jgi:hypothetical protein